MLADAMVDAEEKERAQHRGRLAEDGWRIRGADDAARMLGIKPAALESR
jgi:hypothetical protein